MTQASSSALFLFTHLPSTGHKIKILNYNVLEVMSSPTHTLTDICPI